MPDTRLVRQTFNRVPGLELRSTWQSTQAYKRHSHAQVSIGAIMEGSTRCVCGGQEYLLTPGDIIVIPAHVPHSCNPVAGLPRSYHMLYIDADLPLGQQVIRDAPLFKRYLDTVESMSSTALNALLSAIPSLVAHSQNIEDGKRLLEEQDSAFIFRMNVLIEASAALRKARFTPEEADPEEQARKRIRYKKTEKRLADYFNTATGIAKIRTKIEESSDKKALSEMVKIDYNGKKISWNDFFYDEDRYPILFKKAERIAHPVAILITVKQTQKYINTEKSHFYSLKGELCTLEHEDKSKEFFAPSLTCNDTTFFENLEAKDEIIVVGNVRTTTNHWGEGKTFKNLNFSIFNKRQITRLKD